MNDPRQRRKVLIVSESKSYREGISAILPKTDFFPIFHANSGGEARRLLSELPVDILIVDSPLPDEHGIFFAENFCETNLAILLLVKSELYDETICRVEEKGIFVLPKPNSPEIFFTAAKILSSLSFRLQKMETKNKSLQEKMQDARIVNRAKWLLIENLKMTENDAHRHIEKLCMDSRKTKREIAEEIIGRYE
jgi:response regulator NasT